MNKLFILFLSIFTVSAATGVKISDYPRVTTVGTNDLFIISSYNGSAYTTNKSVPYGSLLNQISTAVTNNFGRYNVVNYGAIGDGVTDDTTAVVAAYNAMSSINGGELFFPIGEWKFNLVVTKPNVTITGVSHIHDNSGGGTTTSHLIPAIPANPVIQVGNDSGYVKGITIQNITIDGKGSGALGLSFAGGGFESYVNDVAITRFTNCIKILGGTVNPASIIHMNVVNGQPLDVAGARGILVTQTANYPTSYTTEVSINNSYWDGPNNNGYLFESDSVEVKMVNCYFGVHHNHGFKLSHNFSPFPFLNLINVNIDGGNATNIVFESYNTNRYFFDQVSGDNFLLTGLWKPSSGALITSAQTILRQNAMAGYLNVFGSLNIINDTGGDFIGGNYTNNQISATGGNLFIKAQTTVKVDTGTGVFQVNSAPSTAVATFRLQDTLNNRSADILTSAGDLELKPASSGIKLQNSAGTTALQVNATDGATFLLNAAGVNANTGLFVDSNKQIKSSPTIIGDGSTNVSFKGTVFVDNLVATNGITLGTGGTNLSITGNVLANGLVVTNTFTDNGAFITPTVTISASDLNLATGSLFTKNLSGNTVFTFSNPVEGQQFSVVITNSSTFTVTWPTVEWKGGATPVQSVNQTDVYSFIYANGKYLGVQSPGSPPGVEQEAYSAGTVYSLTATPALLDFGTTDPTVTVVDSGTYLIYWGGNYKYNAATFVANQTANMKVRRTNNTAADISNATLTATTRVITTITDDLAVLAGKPVKYVATSGDILQVWGSLSAIPSAGSVDCTDAWIVLLRIQ